MAVEGNNSNSYGQTTMMSSDASGIHDVGFFESLISEISSRHNGPSTYSFESSSKSTPRMLNVNAHLIYNNEVSNMFLSKLSPEPQPRIVTHDYLVNDAHLLLPNMPISQIHRQGYKRQQSQLMTNVDIYGIEALKKPRLDAYREDVLDHRFNGRLHLEKSLIELQEKNYELKTLIEHQRQQNQIHKHISLLGLEERAAVQAELADRNRAQVSSLPYFDGNICIRRLMQYLYHMRRRPHNNDIDYWRKFSSEYYAPCAKQRWCLSMCKNISQQALDLFTETAMESWCCSICNSKFSKGFEVTYEALPRLFKTNFESGMLDEIMFLGLPQEHIFPSGLIMLEYGKVVQESVYEKFRIVHEGKLRVIFRGDLKIVYWEFCAQCHEEFLQHQLIARQINDFVEAAQKYKSSIDNFDGALSKDMHSSCNMFVTAEHQLARSLQLSLVNDLGFSRKHFRCLQISEVVDTMKDLITISQELGVGPIECLKNYSKLKEGKETRTANSEVTTRDGSDDGQEVLQFQDGHGKLNRTLS